MTLLETLLDRVEINEETRCWEWTWSITAAGYAQINRVGLDTQLAHRVIYELVVAPIPEGWEIDHRCRVRRCINPYHLEAVTHAENQRRGRGVTGLNAQKTSCPRGHPYDRRRPDGSRRCSICDGARSRRQWLAIKAARSA